MGEASKAARDPATSNAALVVRPARRLRADLLVTATIGLFLLFFGLRQAISALIVLPSNPTLKAIDEQRAVSADALTRLIGAEQSALAIQETAEGWGNLGLALSLQYRPNSTDRATLRQARQAVVRSLSLAPADPYNWMRLAVVELILGTDYKQVATDWRMAFLTGPNETQLRGARAALAITLWTQLSDADRDSLFTDIRGAWHENKDAVVAMAADPFTANVIRAALVVDLSKLIAFEKMLADKGAK